jgi:hypothetical protein
MILLAHRIGDTQVAVAAAQLYPNRWFNLPFSDYAKYSEFTAEFAVELDNLRIRRVWPYTLARVLPSLGTIPPSPACPVLACFIRFEIRHTLLPR